MIGGYIGKPIGGVVATAAVFTQDLTANVDCAAASPQRAIGKIQVATSLCTATVMRAIAFAQTATCVAGEVIAKAVAVTLQSAFSNAAAVALKNAGLVLLSTSVSALASLVQLALNIVSTTKLHKPIDYILAGQQHYKQSGREYEIRPSDIRTRGNTMRSGVRALRGSRPSFTTTTSKRGYD